MNRRVRVATLLLLLLLLLGGFTLAIFMAQFHPEEPPVAARARPEGGNSVTLGDLAAGSAFDITCTIRTVESPDPPAGAVCTYLFPATLDTSGFDGSFQVTTTDGVTASVPQGADGTLTATAPGYRSQTQRLVVTRAEEIPFVLRLQPDSVPPPPPPPPPGSGAPPAPPPPPPPPPDLGDGGGGPGSPPPSGDRGTSGVPQYPGPPYVPGPACSDTLDNDVDGLIDYPADPGCTDPNDNDEWNDPVPAYAWRFGRHGVPRWDQYTSSVGAPEPTIGLSWVGANFNTPRVLMQFGSATYRLGWGTYASPSPYNPTGSFPTDVTGNETAPPNPTWVNTNNPHPGAVPNVDPLLWTDRVTGRTLAGGLAGWNSVFGMTDNDGTTWDAAPYIAYSGASWDHQGLGSGPYSTTVAVPSTATYPASGPKIAFYYCSQTPPGVMACTRSDDGGKTWQPTTNQAYGGCGGLHGHPLVSRVDGSVYVPARNCGGMNGMAMSTNNGLTWMLRTVPGSSSGNGGFDPDIGISVPAGTYSTGNWLYYAQGDNSGIHVALSKQADRLDLGTVPLGGGNGVNNGMGAGWLDLGALVNPPVVRAVFPDVQVGDDLRAAVSFLGSTQDFDHDACVPSQKWYYYVAMTHDGGIHWNVTRTVDHPVQSGGVWSQGGSNPCRNLLDFNDMQMDAHGRLYIGLGDGCIAPGCTATSNGQGTTNTGAIIRQRTGCGLFAAFDEGRTLPNYSPTCARPPE